MSQEKVNNKTVEASQNELVVKRIFDAPRDLVFEAWSQPEHLAEWWGPKGYTMQIAKFDLRPGGIFHYNQRSPEGEEAWGKFDYREIVKPEKLVFTNSFSDEEGNTVRAPFNPAWPLEILNTLTFSEHEGKTRLILRGIPISATDEEVKAFKDAHEMLQQGFTGTLDQLADYLTNM